MSRLHGQSDNKRSTPTKRPRPVISCLTCRQKKLKCDRLRPCQQCIRGGRAQSCQYAPGQEPELREHALLDGQSPGSAPHAQGRELSTVHESRQVDGLIERLRSIEDALQSRQAAGRGNSDDSGHPGSSNDTVMDVDHVTINQSDMIPGASEGRLLLYDFPAANSFIEALCTQRDDMEIHVISEELHELDTILECPDTSRTALYTSNEEVLRHMLRLLPDIRTCKTLINLYFENFEHCARILHRSVFLKESTAFFANNLSSDRRNRHVPILLAVLTVSSLLNTLPECTVPQLHGRSDGIGTAELLDCWFKRLRSAEERQISTLQTRLLLMLIRRMRCDRLDALWTMSGDIVRQGMLMHLHKPASHPRYGLDGETRRRLWVTIVEQDLALSIMCNMPPHQISGNLIAPLNVNDEDLCDEDSTMVVEHPKEEWTDGLCQSFLAESFNARLQAYNIHHHHDQRVHYSQVLQYAIHIEQILHDLPSPFRLDQNNHPGRLMAQMEIDMLLRRPLIALYAPFAKLMPPDDRFREARMAWVQSNLVLLCYQDLFDPKYPGIDVPRPEGYWDFYYTTYSYDIFYALMAETLEFQRMKRCSPDAEGSHTSTLQRHAASFQKLAPLGWNIEGMTKSIEETIDPLVRRVGNAGPGLCKIVTAVIAFASLTAEDPDKPEASIILTLKQMIETIRSRLQRDATQSQVHSRYPWNMKQARQLSQNAGPEWLAKYLLSVDDP